MSARKIDLESSVGVVEGISLHTRPLLHREQEFFLYLCRKLKLYIPAVKGYRATVNHVLSMAGTDLATSKTCLPREVNPPKWNLSMVRGSLPRPPYELLKLSLDKHQTCKTCFLLHALAK